MSFYDYARDWFLAHLERDIAAHEAGHFDEIGAAFDDAPPIELLEDEAQAMRLGCAYEFWDAWIDARNHDWGYYSGLETSDWSTVARQICRGLRDEWEPQRMRENAVFDPPLKVPFWQRLQRLGWREKKEL